MPNKNLIDQLEKWNAYQLFPFGNMATNAVDVFSSTEQCNGKSIGEDYQSLVTARISLLDQCCSFNILNQMKNMVQKVLKISLMAVLVSALLSCEVDDFSEEILTGADNPAPAGAISGPTANVKFDVDFDISAQFSDDSPGLSEATFTIVDATGDIVFQQIETLIGTTDSKDVTITAKTLGIGTHTLTIVVKDTEGAATELTQQLITEGTLSNNTNIFMLGSMNGWGGTDLEMELIADFTWQLTGVAITTGDAFKFANTSDFSNVDWGDEGCDDVASDTEDNIGCVTEDGSYRVTFNTETLAYSLDKLQSNETEMFILGSMNGWGGTDLAMSLVDDNTWTVTSTIDLVDTDEFKFVNTSNFSDRDWADTDCDGIAEETSGGGGNTNCGFAGSGLVFTFNDETLAYSVQ